MGVLLPKLGMPKDPIIWSARALVDEDCHPLVVKAHRAFIDAGAEVIIANTYSVIPGYLGKANLIGDAGKLCAVAGQLARDAAGPSGKGAISVLGSLPPLVDSYRADLMLPEAEAVDWYAMMSKALLPYVDLFVCETMSCPQEATSALRGLEQSCPGAKAWVTYTVDSKGLCRDGTPFNIAVRDLIGRSNVSGVGVNCCMPEAVELAMSTLDSDAEASSFAADLERIVYANAYPKEHSEGLEYSTEDFDDEAVRSDFDGDSYAGWAAEWASRSKLPFTVIGGCCGVLPAHIQSMTMRLNQRKQS